VDDSTRIELTSPKILRGYKKLQIALDTFGISPTGKVALDAGAAAGGFTKALLDHGAARVYAVDVGFGQLLGSLRQDPRVVNLERTNIGELDVAKIPETLDLIALDLGYLALSVGVPQLNVLEIKRGGLLVALVKPVSELGLSRLPESDKAVEQAIATAANAIQASGWFVVDSVRSPVLGGRGAREGFIFARRL
jgi:23S rRNA (cytidine1920-2'-O)/16S rRNA (cytidine1409-2'-O)-methyltransferase